MAVRMGTKDMKILLDFWETIVISLLEKQTYPNDWPAVVKHLHATPLPNWDSRVKNRDRMDRLATFGYLVKKETPEGTSFIVDAEKFKESQALCCPPDNDPEAFRNRVKKDLYIVRDMVEFEAAGSMTLHDYSKKGEKLYLFWHHDEFVVDRHRLYSYKKDKANQPEEVARALLREMVKKTLREDLSKIFEVDLPEKSLHIAITENISVNGYTRGRDDTPLIDEKYLKKTSAMLKEYEEIFRGIRKSCEALQAHYKKHGGIQGILNTLMRWKTEEALVEAPLKINGATRHEEMCAQYILQHAELFNYDRLFPHGVDIVPEDDEKLPTVDEYLRRDVKNLASHFNM